MLAMVGFTLIGIGLLGLHITVQDTSVEPLAFWSVVVGWLGIGLSLPFYGGEAFGLHAIGQEALKEHSVSLVALADVVRGGPELEMFLIGLLLVAVAAIMAAVAIWRSALLNRWSGLPFAIAWALFIPQFTAGQPLRVAHGLVLTIGCIWIAVEMWRSLPLSAERTVAPTAKASRSR